MARIPISQIPNAPQAGAPVLAPTLPGISALQPINVGSGFDTSGISRTQGLLDSASNSISRSNSDVAQATANTKRNLIDPRPFVAAAGAGQFVGEALQHAGNVVMNFADQMLRAKDAVDQSKVDAILRNARDQHQIDIEQNQISPNKWVPTWNEKQGEVQEQINDLNISPRIRGQVNADVSTFWGRQTMDFAVKATTQSINDGRNVITSNVTKAADDGDWLTAFANIQGGVNAKLFSEKEGEQLQDQVVSKQRDDLVNIGINGNPSAMMEASQESMKTGNPMKGYDWLTSEQVSQVNSKARSVFNGQRSTALQSADNGILSGEITTKEQIRNIGKENGLFDERDMKSLEDSLTTVFSESPAGLAKIQNVRADIRAEIASYDPTNDPKQEKYYEISDRIRTELPAGFREDPLKEIWSKNETKTALKPNEVVRSSTYSSIRNLLDDGYFGTWSAGSGDDKKVDHDKRLAASEKANRLMDAFDDYQQKNPNISREDGTEWLLNQTKADRQTQKAGSTIQKSSWFQDGIDQAKAWAPIIPWQGYRLYNHLNPDTPRNQKINEKLGGKPMSGLFGGSGKTVASNSNAPSFLGQVGPASIRYNNPGAMYPGPSSKKFGSTETKTIGGGHKIAIFPDAVSGAAAQIDLLHRNYTGKTLQSAITKWSGGNDVPTYLKVIEKETGLKPDAVLTPELIENPTFGIAIARAMALQEAGKAYPLTDAQWLEAHKKAFST